ncbi:KH domain-containing protein, partial [Candidatus Peregrinibacteria bacterium]|nr:KH domain-containing protein [Candidatus Peregrinibacteria bacterium]
VNEREYFDELNRRIKKRAAVFVEEAQRPMAIGKKGQNIRLASELSGFELDMYNYEELPAFQTKLAQVRGETVPEETEGKEGTEVNAETEGKEKEDEEGTEGEKAKDA